MLRKKVPVGEIQGSPPEQDDTERDQDISDILNPCFILHGYRALEPIVVEHTKHHTKQEKIIERVVELPDPGP